MSSAGLEIGQRLIGGRRTITDAEVSLLPAYMGAINALFHDEVTASETPLGGRVLYGPALLGIAIALTEPLLHDHVIALRLVTDVRFRAPVHPGDTVHATAMVAGLRDRDRDGGRGASALLTTQDSVENQHGDVVLTFSREIVVRRDPGDARP